MFGKLIEKWMYLPDVNCNIETLIKMMFVEDTYKTEIYGLCEPYSFMKNSTHERILCFSVSCIQRRSNARKILAMWKELTTTNRIYFRLGNGYFAWVEYYKNEYYIYHARLPTVNGFSYRDTEIDILFSAKRKTEFEVVWYLHQSTTPIGFRFDKRENNYTLAKH